MPAARSLPHYSVAQYEQSTPISFSALQPGDLVFWGSSSSPSSIYHVALYVGGGEIIQAPRTGVPGAGVVHLRLDPAQLLRPPLTREPVTGCRFRGFRTAPDAWVR